MRRSIARAACLFGLLVSLSACQMVRSDVTRFHSLPAKGNGETFVVVPTKDQEGSLEFRQFAALAAEHMRLNGYRELPFGSPADLAVMFGYAVDGGRTTTSQVPIWGQTGGGYGTTTGNSFGSFGSTPWTGTYTGTTYTPPTYGVVGAVPVTNTTYTRALALDIFDLRRSTPDRFEKVFEAKVRSQGQSGNISEAVPYMLRATFADFPGKSGETKTVTFQRRND